MVGEKPNPWQKELDDFARAFGGAFLFGIPLLFTMEMWWIGVYADLWRLVLFLAIALAANASLAHFAGFKKESSTYSTINQAVDAVAVGLVASTAVLLVLNRITPGDPLDAALGKIVIQAVPLSIGASVANIIFMSREGGRTGGDEGGDGDLKRATLNDLGATVVGGVFLGFAIAPTEEIPMLAAEMDVWHELALICLTLVVSYVIVFESGFSPQETDDGGQGLFHHPLSETLAAYAVSLLVSLAILFMFQRVTLEDPLPFTVSQVLVLGLPITVGGAAGRLVI